MGNLRFIPIYGILLTICVTGILSLSLNPDGGYNLIISVKEDTAIPTEHLKYLQNLKLSMQVFSTNLWRATKQRFYVNSVQLHLPSSWAVGGAVELAESGGGDNADFRILPGNVFPHAKNPNLCGLPGDYLQLPLSFFNNANTNEYGPIWKTLMVLFARYRFGVWEEHGFFGDARFPYFYQNQASANWEVTSCTNQPLKGKFMNITHIEDDEECAVNWETPESSLAACRFVPDRVNLATTSLMHFHWMDSVVDFCDEHSHNTLVDNKQNTFCDHKSIMQVIRESPDYAAVTTPRTISVPAIKFETVRDSSNPVFYILIDRGLIQGSHLVAKKVPEALAAFLQSSTGGRDMKTIIAAIGSYPNSNGGQLKEEVGWTRIGKDLPKFLMALVGEGMRIDGPLERDFSRAILDVVGKIKERKHAPGAVILVVKYGADLDKLSMTVPQAEVIAALNEQKIVLHSLELAITPTENRNTSLGPHLTQVAQDTNGNFSTLIGLDDADNALNGLLSHVRTSLFINPPYNADFPTRITLTKADVSSTPYGIQIQLPQAATEMDVFYSSNMRLTADNFTVTVDDVDTVVAPRRIVDWNAQENDARYSYSFKFDASSASKVRVIVNCETQGCGGSMFARAAMNMSADTTGDMIDIEISTSSNVVDLSEQTPLTIYAKATINGNPVTNLLAEAVITKGDMTNIITLSDDGSLPDVLEKDGIYSAYYVPVQSADGDGDYIITVEFVSQMTSRTVDNHIPESSRGRLLPIDQDLGENAPCEFFGNCTSETVNEGFMQVAEPIPVSFKNATQFQARPAKVFTFYIPATRVFSWLAPKVPGFSTQTRATAYEIRKSPSISELVNNFDNCEIAVDTPPIPEVPGVLQQVVMPIQLRNTYFAVKSVYQGLKSDISNVRSAIITIPVPSDPTEATSEAPTSPSSGSPSSDASSPVTMTGSPTTESPISSPATGTQTQVTGDPVTVSPVTGSMATETTIFPTDNPSTQVTNQPTSNAPTSATSQNPGSSPQTTEEPESTTIAGSFMIQSTFSLVLFTSVNVALFN